MRAAKFISMGALSLAIFATSIMPAGAVTMPAVGLQKTSDAEQVQWRRDRPGWYHGHHGYRGYRPGYRRHSDGFWYPLAAFGAGAIIGGAIAGQNQSDRVSNRHVRWCAERYQSYRSSDNTYVVRSGVRAKCNSPYN